MNHHGYQLKWIVRPGIDKTQPMTVSGIKHEDPLKVLSLFNSNSSYSIFYCHCLKSAKLGAGTMQSVETESVFSSTQMTCCYIPIIPRILSFDHDLVPPQFEMLWIN